MYVTIHVHWNYVTSVFCAIKDWMFWAGVRWNVLEIRLSCRARVPRLTKIHLCIAITSTFNVE